MMPPCLHAGAAPAGIKQEGAGRAFSPAGADAAVGEAAGTSAASPHSGANDGAEPGHASPSAAGLRIVKLRRTRNRPLICMVRGDKLGYLCAGGVPGSDTAHGGTRVATKAGRVRVRAALLIISAELTRD